VHTDNVLSTSVCAIKCEHDHIEVENIDELGEVLSQSIVP